jgi:hypothetical protein
MIGLDVGRLFSIIDKVTISPPSQIAKGIGTQGSLEPRDILIRFAAGVAKAIEANNQAIEEQLKR